MAANIKILPDVKEALNEYYKLKLKYETIIMANKKKIINNPTLSKREKRSEFLKLKPKCINCQRPGGTIFKTTFHAENETTDSYREHSATCGILSDPCNLKITIQMGKVEMLLELLNEMEKEIKTLKNKVIDDKNKLLFGYLTTEEALNNFAVSKEEISLYSSLYERYLETYNNLVDNEEKKVELNDSITNLYIQIDEVKNCITKMNETDNYQYAHDAATIYTTRLIPLLDIIRTLKYNESYVVNNEDANTCDLIQKKYSIENMSLSLFQNKVMNFDTGYEAQHKKKPKGLIIEDSSSSSSEPMLIKNPSARKYSTDSNGNKIPEDNPIYGKGSDGIGWKLPEYTTLWNKLPMELKNVLRPENEWMKEFMFDCVNKRANNQTCIFVAPRNLKIPPEKVPYLRSESSEKTLDEKSESSEKLPEYKYDLGVQIYSDVFNKLPESLQNTYLSLYSTEDGVKKYDMFIDALNNLVAKEVKFNKGIL